MNKEYILNGFSILVRPEEEEQFLQMNPTATLAEGNQQSSTEDATVEQETAASNQQANQPQETQQQDTGSQSEDTSLDFVNQVTKDFQKFKATEEQSSQANQNSLDYINNLTQKKDQDLSGVQQTSSRPVFSTKFSHTPTMLELETDEYKNAKKEKQDSQKEFKGLQQQALDRLLKKHNYQSDVDIQKDTPEYEEWLAKTKPFTTVEMAKIKQEEEELSIFENNIKDFAEENDVFAIAKGEEQKDLRDRAKQAVNIVNEKAQVQIKKSKAIEQNLNTLPEKYNNLKQLNTSLNDLNKEAQSILDTEYKTQEEVDKANARLAEIKNQFDVLNSDYEKDGGLTYEQLVEFRDYNLKAFNNVSKNSEDIVTKQEELAGYLDAIDRDYGWAANIAGTLASVGVDAVSSAVELGDKFILDPTVAAINKATGPDAPDWIKPLRYLPAMQNVLLADKGADDITNYLDKVSEDITNGLEKPGKFNEIENVEDFGEWFGHLVSSQALNTAITFTTGGASLAILGGLETGRRFKELDKDIAAGEEYNFTQYYGTAVASGLVETGTEMLTLRQARGIKSLLRNNPEAKRGFANVLKKNFATRRGVYNNIYEPGEEALGEGFVQFSNNVMDKFVLGKEDVSLMDGVGEASVSGAFMSGIVYKSPLIGKNVVKAFQSADTTQELADISDKIQKKTKILGEVELSPENKAALESDIVGLVNDHRKVMDESISNIDKMTPQEKQTLMNVDVAVASLKANNKSIRGEFGLTEEQIADQVADNNAQIANFTAIKNQTIANASKSENLSRVERDTDRLEKMSTKLFGKPVQVVRINKDNADEQLKTYKKAEIEAVDKKIAAKEDQLLSEEADTPKIRKEIKQLKADKATIKNTTKEALLNGHGANAIHADMIIVNPEFAAERGATNVVQHETMHQLLKNTLADNKSAAVALGNAVDEILLGQDPDAVAQSEMSSRLTAYAKEPQKVRAEEKVTLLMDAIKSGDIKVNRSLGSKLKDPIRRIIQSTGLKKGAIKLDSADDVLNFITDVNAKSNIFTKNNAFTRASLEGISISKELTAGVEDVQDDGSVPIKQSKEASEKVQSIYEEQGEAGAFDIIDQFKPIVNKIVEKRREAPNFDKQLLTDEIETGKRGIFDLIREYKPESGVPLAAYINKFLPARAIEASRRVLGEEFTDDVTEAKGVTATDTAEDTMAKEAKPKRKGIVLADRLKVKEQVAPIAEQYVKDNDLTGTTYKKTPNIATETVGKLMSIPSKKITSNANLSKPELANAQMFIAKNADMLQSMLPEGATNDGTATGVQKVLLDQFYNKKSKRAKTKAGLTTQAKRPDITRSQFLEVFGIVDGKPQRDDRNTSSRVLALAKQLDRAMSNQAIREVLTQDDTQAATVQQMASGKSPVMFSTDAVSTSNNLKGYASVEPRRMLKDAGIKDILLDKIAKIEGTKISRTRGEVPVTLINFEATIPLQKIGKEVGRDATIGSETSRIIKTMAELDPTYATMFRIGMSNGQGKSFFGVKDVFDELSGMRRYELPDFLKRFRFHSGQKLDPKKVIKKNGEVRFVIGKQELSGKEFFNFEQQKLDYLAKMFTDIQKHLKKNPDDAWFFSRFVTNASSNGDAIFRTSASLAGVYYKDGKLNYNIEMREEHSMPQNNIGTMFLGAAINQTPISDVLKVAKASFIQLSLTQVDDNMLKAIKDKDGNILRESLVDSMPNEFWEKVVPAILNNKLPWLDLGMASMIRYAKGGINLNNYFLPSKNMTIPEYFKVGIGTKGMSDAKVRALVDVQNSLISQILEGDITRDQASKYMDAISNVDLIANEADIKNLKTARKAKEVIRKSMDGTSKGMSTFDFDETLIIGGENFVVATDPVTKQQVKITSEQWPIEGPKYAGAGYEFDFSDFANVRGGKEGPLLQKLKNQIKKYGNENVFILTARQQASAAPIQQWLKTQGIDLPLKNITGLGKSEGEAKAQWMLEKFAQGYNDMYFVDDAMPNVRAVKQVLDQLDIKSKVVQAKIKFSQDGGAVFNEMLERVAGVPKDKIFSEAQAKRRGAKVSRLRFFVPPSAEDFKGLLYNFLGRGKKGDADMAFFKEHLLDPFAKGINELNVAKQRISEEFKALRKKTPEVVKKFNKKVADSDYTVNDAIRVYLWDKNDIEIPGLSEQERSLLSDYVKDDSKIKAFADVLGSVSRAKEGYVLPSENWVVGSIASDLFGISNNVNRAEYLSEWKDNVDVVFSPENMNKIESVYGTNFREQLDKMLEAMETGSSRTSVGKDKTVNNFMDWINGSVGAVMFFNTRSASLQTLSTVNFIDWNDNNIFKAAGAFANQPQYWKDFMTLFNSDMLKQRRAGMEIDVNLAELSSTVAKSNMADKSKAAIRYLLQIGFTPTQIADSFAIASGGATYYRNKIKKYTKDGMDQKEAESQAFLDFQEIAEETQQSSRPDLISNQQRGSLGRLVLAWANTPMQYTRLTKKAISDLVNGRGDWRSHVSRILYYGAMQNVIFGSLQTGLAFLAFGGDEDEDKTNTKVTRMANGALDTLLRGTGVYGAMASTLKNTIMKYSEEKDKPYGKRELSKVGLELVQLSPPIGSKIRKVMKAIYSKEFNKGVIEKMGVDLDNPALDVIGNIVEAATNVPLARAIKKAQQIEEAVNGNHETWKQVALVMGWDKWSLNVKDADVEKAKVEVKEERAEQKKKENKIKKEENKKAKEEQKKLDEENEKKEKEAKGIKDVRCSGIKSNGQRCKITVETKEKTVLCGYHKSYKPNEGSDRDGDGIKEYRCTGTTGSGKRCKNRTENTNKKCYAHQ